MKKKLIKKLNFSNRNIHIKYYNNYLIYSYLNNYNLKLFFYYLSKKRKLKNINKYCIRFYKYLNLRYLTLFNNLYIEKNFNFLFNYKNKYFMNTNNIQNNNFILNNKLKIISEKTFYRCLNSNYNSYVYKIININYLNIFNVYNTLFFIFYFMNLIKIYEFYKNFINIIYFNL